jgi:hypothetical protein
MLPDNLNEAIVVAPNATSEYLDVPIPVEHIQHFRVGARVLRSGQSGAVSNSPGHPSFGSLLRQARGRLVPTGIVFLAAVFTVALRDPTVAAIIVVTGVAVTLLAMTIAYRRVVGDSDAWARTRVALADVRRHEALRDADSAFEFLVMERSADNASELVGECRRGQVVVGDVFRSVRAVDGSTRDAIHTVRNIKLFDHEVTQLPRGRGGAITVEDSSHVVPGDVLYGDRGK